MLTFIDDPPLTSTQVNGMVSEMVNASLTASQGADVSSMNDFAIPSPGPGAQEILEEYMDLLKYQLATLSRESSMSNDPKSRNEALSTFSRTLLGSPELRQEIEPLIVFLVVFATKQIEADALVE